MTPDQQHILWQMTSPAWPVGSFAFSHGLETAIADGTVQTAEELYHWLDAVLAHGAGRADTILLAHAFRADAGELAEIAALAEAFCPTAERLTETLDQGAAFARTARAVWGDLLPDLPYPVAFGRTARLHGLPLADTAHAYLHAMLSNLVSAAVRFVPLGQTDGQRVLSRLATRIAPVVDEALLAPLDDIGGSAWGVDIASMDHETLQPRIFRT